MTLPPFHLEVPADLQEALGLLEEHGEGASLYVGGTELLLILKLGLATVDVLVDGKRLPELRGIGLDDGALVLGAASTHRAIETSELVQRTLPALAALSARVANPRVRNVGTIGGNLCFAEPHSDPATLLTALGASVDLTSRAGVRRVALQDFFEGPLQTVLREGEIMTRVRIPVPDAAHSRIAFERIAFHERPVANAAVLAAGADTRVVVGAVGAQPARLPVAEDLVRQGADAPAVADAVAGAVEPLEDAHGSPDYKRHLAGVAVARCLRRLAPAR